MRATARPFLAAALLVAAAPALGADPAKPAARPAAKPGSGRTVALQVTMDGFEPASIQAKRGEPLTLVITRTTDKTCATEIVMKDLGINTPLPLGKPVSITITPAKSGQVKFACAMDMIGGVIVVQ